MGAAALLLVACEPVKAHDDAANRSDTALSDAFDAAPPFDAAADVFAATDAMGDAFDAADAATDVMLRSDGPSAADAREGGVMRPAESCSVAPIVVPPNATMRIPVTNEIPWVSASDGPYPGFNCVPGALSTPGASSFSTRFTLSAPSQVTAYKPHDLRGFGTAFGLATDCTDPAQVCIESATYPFIITRVLPAGTYEFQVFAGRDTRLLVEPPVPQPTNLTCATAIPMPTNEPTSFGPRALDVRSRFLRWRSGPLTARAYLRFVSDTTNAVAAFTLRAGCAPGAPVHWRVGPAYIISPPGVGYEIAVAANTEYVLEVSEFQVGVAIEVSFSE